MAMTTEIRLPGIYFLPSDVPSTTDLPPLDVAAFVGFAERGPLHTPVAIEDVDVYEAIFGGDLALARDDGNDVYACLPTAVSAFFANGGRRCYVVRVAGDDATATRLALPGVVSLSEAGDAPHLTPLWTSSPGTWGERLRLGTRLITTPMPAAVFTVADSLSLTWETGSAPQSIQPGDVLQLAFADAHYLFPVTAVSIPENSLPETTASIGADHIWSVISVDNLAAPIVIENVLRLTLDGSEALDLEVDLIAQETLLHLHLTGVDRERVTEGDVLCLKSVGGTDYLFPITDLQALGAWGSPPESVTLATVVSMLSLADDLTLPLSSPLTMPTQVDRLRFEIHLWDETTRHPTIQEMAFNVEHTRFWGETILLDSSGLRANAPADPDGNQASQASDLFRQIQAEKRVDSLSVGLRTTALSGLLAPITDENRNRIYLPLGMMAILQESAFVTPAATDVGENGLETFDESYFLDPDLAGVGSRALLSEAFTKYYVEDRRLRGLHSLLYIDEVAQLSLPDAIHRHWQEAEIVQVADTIPLPDPPPSDDKTFAVCGLPPEITAVVPSSGDVSGGDTVAILGARFDLGIPAVSFGDQLATNVQVITSTMVTVVTPDSTVAGLTSITVSNSLGTAFLDDAFRYVRPTIAPLPELPDVGDYQEETLLTLQKSMLDFCQARRDVVSILGLPRHFEKRQCIAWQESLRQKLGLPSRRRTNFDDVGSLSDLSYAAVYHPWVYVTGQIDGSLRALPPDGAVCGLVAARELERDVWVAPANQPIQGVLSLHLPFSKADWTHLFELQFNVIRQEARDFRVMSAHTLSDDRLLLQLSVRRLMILLRKTAVELGMDFVFENNDPRLWDHARLLLEGMLEDMFARGAFAGATTQEAYRVNTGGSVNTRQHIDLGQFHVEIQVAPSQPMEFITILLIRTSEGAIRTTESL